MSTASVPGTSDAATAARPAILGGAPAVTAPHEEACRWPLITEQDEAAVLAVMRSGHLSINPVVNELEEDYRTWLGVKHALAHNNGTGALHASMHACEIGHGDEVIVPSATWWASVMPVLHAGGIPVFAETDDATLGLDPVDVEQRITSRTKAIMLVHLFGVPSNMDGLLDVARRHNLKVIEDASHAHGAKWNGKPIGTLGDCAVFSMQANKLCPSSEGGIFLTDDDDMYERATRYGHYERLIPRKDWSSRRYAATGFGMKFRMSPLSAALARSQFAQFPKNSAIRNANCVTLSRRLESLGFETFLAPDGVERAYFEFLVRYRPAADDSLPIELLAKALQAEGAQVGAPRYPLLHQQPMFTDGRWASIARLDPSEHVYDPMDLPRTIAGNGQLLKLPNFTQSCDTLIEQYAQAFEKVMGHASEIGQEAS